MRTTIAFETPEGDFSGEVEASGVFHEALELLIPERMRIGRRITIRTPSGDSVYPDMFIGETVSHFGTTTFRVTSEPLRERRAAWRNLGFDHLALAVADRADARRFFGEILGMQIVREDEHQTVLTTGNTAIFLFDSTPGPLNPGIPSRIHHIGFVVDDLESAWHSVRSHGLQSDYMVLERDERWSLYFFYQNGGARFMIQLSQIKDDYRGFADPRRFTDVMFDYSRGQYGVRFGEEEETALPKVRHE